MRVILDTNVLVSGFSSPHGAPGQLLALWLAGVYDLILSEHILTEAMRTLAEPYFSQRLTPDQQATSLQLLRRNAEVVEITIAVENIAPSREDDLILATALSAQAAYVVAGDKELERVGSYQQVTIISPREFLDRLTATN